MNAKAKFQFLSLLSAAALAQTLSAAPLAFDFKDPKGVNNATFTVDALLESTSGLANGISGAVTFDPQNPAATTGAVIVSTASLHVPNPLMDKHLHSAMWLDASTYPEIKFTANKLTDVNIAPSSTSSNVTVIANAIGAFTVKGISHDMTIPVKLTYLEDKLGQRTPGQKGDLLVLRAHFSIKRSDFNIQPNKMEDKVSDAIEINLSIVGASPKL